MLTEKECKEFLQSSVFREYEKRIEAHFRASDARIESYNLLLLEKFEGLKDLSKLGDEMRSLALRHAKDTNDFRLEGMNELRKQINEERGRYVEVKELGPRLEAVYDRLSKLELKISYWDGKFWMLGAGLAALFTLTQIVLYWSKGK